MRAVEFSGHKAPLAMISRDAGRPGPGEVAIAVAHCGICGSDIHLATETVFGLKPGAVLGHEYSGTIAELGEGVSGLAVGDRVAVIPVASCGRCRACLAGEPADCPEKKLVSGGFAERAVVSAAQCVRMPAGLSFEHGALAEPLAVALHGLTKSRMRPGARIVVIGAGPIGLLTAWWARRLGAVRVAVTAASMRKAELSRALGADAFIGPEALTPEGVSEVLGGLADFVFECAGKPGLIDKALTLIRRGGTVVGLGLITEPDTLDALTAMRKEARIQMAGYFTRAEFEASLAALAQDGATIARLITRRIELAELPSMFEELKRGNAHCKVMVSTG